MSTSKPTAKRKVGDEHRQFQEKWETEYFFVEHRGMPTCLICTEKLAVQKEYNVRRHYSTKHAEEYAKYKGDEREDPVAKLKTSKKMSTEATRSFQESMLMSTIITPEAAPLTTFSPELAKKKGSDSFFCYATKMWNALPTGIKECQSLLSFKTALKEHLWTAAIHTWPQ